MIRNILEHFKYFKIYLFSGFYDVSTSSCAHLTIIVIFKYFIIILIVSTNYIFVHLLDNKVF